MMWHHVEMGQVADVVSGYGFPREYQGLTNGEFPFFKVGDMNLPGNEKCMTTIANTISVATLKKLKAKTFPKGTVIFPKIGAAIATNKKRVLTQPSVVDNNVMGLIPKPHINSWYVYYWMLQFDLRCVSNIGPVPSMRKTEVERVSIPLPPLSEQHRIVEILDQADALRKKRVEADAKAARILPALFCKMFGDPARNPHKWNIKPLGQIIRDKPQYGANASAVEWVEGLPRYVRITDITENGRLLKSGEVTLDLEDWEPYRLVPGDLLFARSGNTVGKTYLYRQEDGLCAYAGYLIRFKADPEQVTPWYLFALTQTGYYKSWVEARKRVAGQPNVNGKEYSTLQIPCPPLSRQQQFTAMIESLVTSQNKLAASKERIDRLFNIILHRAFTSELTGKWREAHMKELLSEMEAQTKALELTKSTNDTEGKTK
jgi:type I restriction enzyme, S subunit